MPAVASGCNTVWSANEAAEARKTAAIKYNFAFRDTDFTTNLYTNFGIKCCNIN